MQAIIFHPKARDEIRSFPKEPRARLGRGLFRLQLGETLGMPIARPMPTVAPGVSELRVKGEDGIFRVFYFTAKRAGHPGISRVRQEDTADTTARNRVGKETSQGVA